MSDPTDAKITRRAMLAGSAGALAGFGLVQTAPASGRVGFWSRRRGPRLGGVKPSPREVWENVDGAVRTRACFGMGEKTEQFFHQGEGRQLWMEPERGELGRDSLSSFRRGCRLFCGLSISCRLSVFSVILLVSGESPAGSVAGLSENTIDSRPNPGPSNRQQGGRTGRTGRTGEKCGVVAPVRKGLRERRSQ